MTGGCYGTPATLDDHHARCAALAALALFLGMRSLIAYETLQLDEPRKPYKPVINDVPADVTIDDTRKFEPVEPIDPPPPVERKTVSTSLPEAPQARVSGYIPPTQATITKVGGGFVMTDRDVQPIVRVPPQYPPRALNGGREGQCLMRFNVDASGQPYDVQALRCSENVFARPSIRAVAQWRYAPKIVDGVARDYIGVETVVAYEMAN